ncbi:MAG: hypothetical protein QXT25_01965 [Candidatus Anstonellaceae archaeon]
MPAPKKDEMLGEIKGRIPLYSNGIDLSGQIILCQEGVIIEADGNTLKVPFRYITLLEKSGDLPLGKVGVEMEVFDQAGNKYYYHFGMSDTHFLTLKNACKKL